MKKVLLVALVMFLNPDDAFSGVHERTQKTLEMGLRGLRASARDLYRKNALLREENRRLEEQLRSYQSRLEDLNDNISVQEAGIARPKYDLEEHQLSALRREERELAVRWHRLKEQERVLERDIASREERTRKIRQRIGALQEESARVKEKIAELEASWKGFGQSKERALLRREVAAREERVAQLKRRLKRLQAKNKGPRALWEELKAQNALLKQQLSALEQDLAVAEAEIKGIEQEIQDRKRRAEKEVLQLQQQIDQLTLRRQELKLILQKARKKLKAKGVHLKVDVAEEIRLKENITALRKEHKILLQEAEALEKKIATIDGG